MHKNPPTGNWRRVSDIRVQYTVLHQKWVYAEADGDTAEATLRYIIPFGMTKTLTKNYGSGYCKASFTILPLAVKDVMTESDSFDAESYDRKQMRIHTSTEGNKGYGNFKHILQYMQGKDFA